MATDRHNQDPEQRAKSAALRLLARREHSRFELTVKLRQRKLESALIDQVLDEFEAQGWLSDERFADIYARNRVDLRYGPLRIRAELQQKGVRCVPESLAAITDRQWCDIALAARERRFGLAGLADDWAARAKQARFLGQRGFSAEQVEYALDAKGPEDSGQE